MEIAYISTQGIILVNTYTGAVTASIVFNKFREYCKSLNIRWTEWVQGMVDYFDNTYPVILA